jgi:DNA-binding response OmpR family regulator
VARLDVPCVLIVDDELSIQTMLRAVLSCHDYRPVTAGRVDEAVAILNEQRIDAVILDVRMPGASGIALLEYIRFDGRWPDLPVLLLTGSQLSEDEERMVARLGAYVFFKPEHHDCIVAQLNRAFPKFTNNRV